MDSRGSRAVRPCSDANIGHKLPDMTTAATEVLRAAHESFRPGIEAVRLAGDAVGATPAEEADILVDLAYEFLVNELVPHAVAEDRVLYPAVDRIVGAAGATWTMRRDHVELGRLIDRLATLRAVDDGRARAHQSELRKVLYSIDGLVRLHLAKEEELYLPLLDERMDEPWVAALADVMAAVVAVERDLQVPA